MNIIVDNFFERPDLVLELANSLEYSQNNNNYPGFRTEDLGETHPEFSKLVAEKTLSLITCGQYEYYMTMYFQKVSEEWSSGIVHRDFHYNGIIYLNKNNNAGTSIKKLKKLYSEYDDEYVTENFATENYEANHDYVKKQNKDFETTINVKGIFNRLFLFDGEQHHSANKFELENAEVGEERLMLVMFFHRLIADEDSRKKLKRFII